MRINIHAQGFQLRSQLRAFAESRVLSALGPFRDRIESTVVDLRAKSDRSQPSTASCHVVVSLHPSGEVVARAEKAWMDEAIDAAIEKVRTAVQNAVLQRQPALAPSRLVEPAIRHAALEIVLDGTRISQQDWEMLERTENHLRPVVARERWKPSEVEHDERAEEREPALATVRRQPERSA
jgi:ribosome-associated translation inhibitor RaiA